jgi:hypothetical protein
MHKELEALVEAGGRYLAGEADSDIPLADALTAARQALVPVAPVAWEAGGVARLDCGACGAKLPEAANYCPGCGKTIKKG